MDPDLKILVSEYQNLKTADSQVNWEHIEAELIDDHEWSSEHALTIVRLARDYGGFVLRNAAALAIAFEHEDGELGI